jgi:hypothetical protein
VTHFDDQPSPLDAGCGKLRKHEHEAVLSDLDGLDMPGVAGGGTGRRRRGHDQRQEGQA